MRNTVLLGFPVEKKNDGPDDPTFVGVNMPAGSEPCGLTYTPEGGLIIFAMCSAPNAPRVWHPMRIALADEPIQQIIGRSLGKVIGMVGINNSPAAVMPDLPWPEASPLQNVEPQGHG